MCSWPVFRRTINIGTLIVQVVEINNIVVGGSRYGRLLFLDPGTRRPAQHGRGHFRGTVIYIW